MCINFATLMGMPAQLTLTHASLFGVLLHAASEHTLALE